MLKFCEAYKVTPNDILYKFIKNTDGNKELDLFNKKIMKLNKRDRKVIYALLDAMLENEK